MTPSPSKPLSSSSSSHLSLKVREWDTALSGPNVPYTALYSEMRTLLTTVRPAALATDGLWSRLSQVTYALALDSYTDLEVTSLPKERFEEALDYANRALLLVPRSFDGNLAKGRALERLDSFSAEFSAPATESLAQCVWLCIQARDRQDPAVLYLDAVVQFAVWTAARQERDSLVAHPLLLSLLPVSLPSVEHSLELSLDLGFHAFDQYALLMRVLVAQRKVEQADALLKAAVARKWSTAYERLAASQLATMQAYVLPTIEKSLSE